MNYKERLDKLVEEGWLISQVHPTLDLTIYNYSQKTQYESNWNEDTLSARGLVLNSKGEVCARPFKKFFNAEEVKSEDIPTETFEVYEKMDGSLGIFFWYADPLTETLQPVFASRGSFTSEQAVKGWEMLKKLPYHELNYGYTHMFEIIYPENRIVVDYGVDEKLVLLGINHTKSDYEVPRLNIEEHLGHSFELVKVYNFTDSWDQLKSHNDPAREGYVLKYANGFRMKVKFEEYVRLHRIITNISNVDIWETLKDGRDFSEVLEKVPDEFYDWVREVERGLHQAHSDILWEAHEVYERLLSKLGNASRKDYALALKDEKLSSIVFRFLDGKRADDIAWKMVKPKWSKPFFKQPENC
jgi:hypothetical protein